MVHCQIWWNQRVNECKWMEYGPAIWDNSTFPEIGWSNTKKTDPLGSLVSNPSPPRIAYHALVMSANRSASSRLQWWNPIGLREFTQSIYQSIYQSINVSIYQYINISISYILCIYIYMCIHIHIRMYLEKIVALGFAIYHCILRWTMGLVRW